LSIEKIINFKLLFPKQQYSESGKCYEEM